MNNRWLCLLVCFVLVLPMTLQANATAEDSEATQLSIFTADDLVTFAKNCRLDTYSSNLSVSLESDIDLSGCTFSSVPIFSGNFDGKGHTISGLSITEDGSAQGLFRYLTADALVQNLHVKGQIHPGGSRSKIGGIAGQNDGQIMNCTFSGSVSGGDCVGAIAGWNGVTGIVDNCHIEGEVHGDHFVGGIVGDNYGVVRNCSNRASVNITPQQNSIEISDISLDTLTNTEAANTVTDIGGIAGKSSGLIRNCENYADVGYQHMGYNIGGVAGTQSGYLVDCANYGNVRGRKEVGGIVGQLEPATVIEYSEDTLQTLQGQLSVLSGMVNQAAGNAQNNANEIGVQIGILQDQTRVAKEAVDALLPNEETEELPDPDTVIAAANTLSATLNAMPHTMNGITAAAQATATGLSKDLGVVSAQIGAMEATAQNASENLGIRIVDVSDLDTAETLTGKVENCVNDGDIFADMNVGGIAGAMAMENDLDVLEDWEQSGEASLNVQSKVRSVILNCINQGFVSGKKQNIGGIVGWQALGLNKGCVNTGKLDCVTADHVGGICGLSKGSIRSCFSRCEIKANTYVGGIAGSGTVVSDCLAQVKILNAREKLGAILGTAEPADVENPVLGNYYLIVDGDYGAIDGISFSGLAESIELDAFLRTENLPDIYQTVTIRFVCEGAEYKVIQKVAGEQLDSDEIPEVPLKDGFTGVWDGLKAAQLDRVLFDMTFHAVYTPYSSTIESNEARENKRPILLVEGSFSPEAVVVVSASEASPTLKHGEEKLESWTIHLNESGKAARFLLPDGVHANNVRLQLLEEDGTWRELSFSVDGSYIVFQFTAEKADLVLIQKSQNQLLVYGGIGAATVAVAVACICLIRNKKKQITDITA